ncbi:MAG: hypothetical protein Tsb009_39920 [Planctomycetaceae bacterium]
MHGKQAGVLLSVIVTTRDQLVKNGIGFAGFRGSLCIEKWSGLLT